MTAVPSSAVAQEFGQGAIVSNPQAPGTGVTRPFAGKANALLEAALAYAAKGWPVFPLRPYVKDGHPKRDNGKTPATAHGLLDATTDPAIIKAWWAENPRYNIGLNCGTANLGAVDLDMKEDKDGIGNWQTLAEEKEFPAGGTLTSHTPSGGRHLVYQMPAERLKNSQDQAAPGIDFRGDGGYIVAPPSVIDGKAYRWENPAAPVLPMPPAAAVLFAKKARAKKPAPPRTVGSSSGAGIVAGPILDLVQLVQADGVALRQKPGGKEWCGACPFPGCDSDDDGFVVGWEGEGRDGGMRYLCRKCKETGDAVSWLIDRKGMGVVEAKDARGVEVAPEYRRVPVTFGNTFGAAGAAVNTSWIQPGPGGKPQPVPDAIRLATGADGGPISVPVPGAIRAAIAAEEVGDAHLFADLYRGKRCYDLGAKQWFRWEGNYWEEHQSPLVDLDAIVKFYEAEKIVAAAKVTPDKKDPATQYFNALVKRVHDLNTAKRRENVLKLAAQGIKGAGGDFDRLGIRGTEWDQQPYLLAVKNGVLKLKHEPPFYEFRPGRQEDFIKVVCPTEWLGIDTPAKLWDKFLQEVFALAPAIVAWLARLIGYALAGNPVERLFVIFWGEGANGKGTFVLTVQSVLGPTIAGSVDSELFLKNKSVRSAATPRPDLLALRGMRLALASENEKGREIDAGELKLLTGNNELTGRWLNSNAKIQFRPTHTLFQETNHEPTADASDKGERDRIMRVPFLSRFVKSAEFKEGQEGVFKINLALKDEMKLEAAGILAWCVRGWCDYAALDAKESGSGLTQPEVMAKGLAEYWEKQDVEGRFLTECLEDSSSDLKSGDLKTAFDAWCRENDCRGKINKLRKMIAAPPHGTGTHEKYLADGGGGTHYRGVDLTEAARELLESTSGPGTQGRLRGVK